MQPMLMIPQPKEESRPVPITGDDSELRALLWSLKFASGLTQKEIARRMGLVPSGVGGVLRGKQTKKPSALWLVRFAVACGGRVIVELPTIAAGEPRKRAMAFVNAHL